MSNIKGIKDVSIADTYKDYYTAYGLYSLKHRSIPDVRDGLKPIGRRILYGMHKGGFASNKQRFKSVKVVGEVMGSYHPHGNCYAGNTKFIGSTDMTIKDLHDNNIESIDVISYDEKTKSLVKARAHSFRIGQFSNKNYTIKLTYTNSHSETVRYGKIVCTANHPHYNTTTKEWVKAEDLKVGDVLLGYDYNLIDDMDRSNTCEVKVSDIDIEVVDSIPMYDFTVDTYENAMICTNQDDETLSVCGHNSSIYSAAALMVRTFSNNRKLLDGLGNFGTIDGASESADRYTELRLDKFSEDVFLDEIHADVVDVVPNYDGRLTEPTVLPAKIPYLLLNGISGITPGFATNIPPYNFGEICDACTAYVENRNIKKSELIKVIPAPDFPTGGFINNDAGIASIFNSGRGSIKIRGKIEKEQNKKGEWVITIWEVPFGVKPNDIVSQVIALNEEGSIKVNEVINMADMFNEVKVRITFHKSETDIDRLEGILYVKTSLEKSFSACILAIVDNSPKEVSVLEVIREFVKFREDVLKRKHKHELDKNNSRLHILEGIVKIAPIMDDIIHIIRNSDSAQEANEKMVKKHKLTTIQADYILRLQLMKLTKLEVNSTKEEIDKLVERNKVLTPLLENAGSNKHVDKIMIDEWNSLKKKYATPRKSIIKSFGGAINLNKLIKPEPCMIILTKNGYIKRLPIVPGDIVQGRGGKGRNIPGLDFDDEVKEILDCQTTTELTLVTSYGKVYNKLAYEIDETHGVGKRISTVFDLGRKETAVLFTTFGEDIKNVMLVLENGDIKLSRVSDLTSNNKISVSRVKKGTKLMNMGLQDKLVAAVGLTMGPKDTEVIIATANGKAMRLNAKDVRVSSNNAGGIKGILLEGDDVVVSACGASKEFITVITDDGYAKRVETSSIRMTARGGKGVRLANKESGKIVYVVDKEDGVLTVITNAGKMLSLDLDSIRITGKTSKGVKTVNMTDDDKIIAVN